MLRQDDTRAKWKLQAKAAKQKERAALPPFNGWVFKPPQMPNVTVRASTQRGTGLDNATYAVFKTSTGNVSIAGPVDGFAMRVWVTVVNL